MRALQIMPGAVGQVANLGLLGREAEQSQINNLRYSIPWLNQVDLLVLDGFFDFTPVQGEILKHLIPAVPNVMVNLNGDERNQDIFRPFQSTIEHLTAIADFKIETNEELAPVGNNLATL